MTWTIPDKGEGANDIQSILFQEYLDVLIAGLNGVDCVLSGGAVTTSSLLTVAVAKAAVLSNETLFAVAATTIAVGTADATNPRIDLIVVNSSGTVAVRAGTAAAAPKPPARTANDVVLAAVYVPALLSTVLSSDITDMRVMRSRMTIAKQKTAIVHNTDSSIFTYFTVTLPNGLFLSGRTLRVRCGGNWLLNSGSCAVTLTIAYGGTTMFADTSAGSTNDADRRGWHLDFSLQAQADNDQALAGMFLCGAFAGVTAPTTGIGDLTLNLSVASTIGGSAAVDSDAADRALTIQFTMSVSNVNDEIVMEYATAELI